MRNSLRKSTATAIAAGIAAISMATATQAGPDNNKLVIEGQELVTDIKAPEGSAFDTLYSGWRFRTPETQALEMDDFDNPAFTSVEIGEGLWNAIDGSEGKSCASCHDDATVSMKGIRAGYPKWNDKRGKPHTLETQINECREERMGAEPWKWESGQMIGMTAYVGLQSRGMPMQVQTDGPMAEWLEKGKTLYYTRVGQLDMACANCHEDNWGNMIRADHLSQGHINGFPTYRLKWQGMGTLHRRFSGCMKNIRAVPYKRGSDEFIALEAYLASRGAGLSIETPSVRN